MIPYSRATARRGLTVLELIVALIVIGVTLLGGRLAIDQVARTARQTIATGREIDRRANADRFVRTLFRRIETGGPRDGEFGGDRATMHFTTWCDTPGGWLERCRSALSFEHDLGTISLVVRLTPDEPHGNVGPRTITVASHLHTGSFAYIDDPAAGGTWFVRWGDGLTTPLAIGIVLDGDTNIVRISERG